MLGLGRRETEAREHAAYLDRQARVFHRRQESWLRFAAAGRTCRLESCGRHFEDHQEFEEHLAQHKLELRRRLVCNQEDCGKKLASPRAWKEHIEEHKAQLKEKIGNGVRSVLLYNKHGLLLEAFEREYREAVGRKVPIKALGFASVYDYLVSIPEVVEVRRVAGHLLLVGRPDTRTQHMARMVASQRETQGGYNVRTSEVVRRLDQEELQELAAAPERRVSRHLVAQLRELVELGEGRLPLPSLPHRYHEEFGEAPLPSPPPRLPPGAPRTRLLLPGGAPHLPNPRPHPAPLLAGPVGGGAGGGGGDGGGLHGVAEEGGGAQGGGGAPGRGAGQPPPGPGGVGPAPGAYL